MDNKVLIIDDDLERQLYEKSCVSLLMLADANLMNPMLATEYMAEFFLERIANHDLRHCDELSDDKAINLVASTLESIMSADTSTGQDEKRLLEARQRRRSIYS